MRQKCIGRRRQEYCQGLQILSLLQMVTHECHVTLCSAVLCSTGNLIILLCSLSSFTSCIHILNAYCFSPCLVVFSKWICNSYPIHACLYSLTACTPPSLTFISIHPCALCVRLSVCDNLRCLQCNFQVPIPVNRSCRSMCNG